MTCINPAKQPAYSSRYFTLTLENQPGTIYIRMELRTDIVNTGDLPDTMVLLTSLFPSVLKTKCFNKRNLQFKEEVLRTEVGHLFEHILLQYLCLAKVSRGERGIVINGKTRWNWKTDPRGTFHIYIQGDALAEDILMDSLIKSVDLTDRILAQNGQPSIDGPSHIIHA